MPLYRTIRVSLSFAALILFSGCWDSIEIEDLALVIGTGFDKLEDGRIEATVQIASPSGASDVTGDSTTHQKLYLVLSETGTSGAQLIERMQKQLASRFSLGHRTIVVYGESFAREGLDQALDQISACSGQPLYGLCFDRQRHNG